MVGLVVPRGKPKYVKGMVPTLQPNVLARWTALSSDILIGTRKDFSKFTCRPIESEKGLVGLGSLLSRPLLLEDGACRVWFVSLCSSFHRNCFEIATDTWNHYGLHRVGLVAAANRSGWKLFTDRRKSFQPQVCREKHFFNIPSFWTEIAPAVSNIAFVQYMWHHSTALHVATPAARKINRLSW